MVIKVQTSNNIIKEVSELQDNKDELMDDFENMEDNILLIRGSQRVFKKWSAMLNSFNFFSNFLLDMREKLSRVWEASKRIGSKLLLLMGYILGGLRQGIF